jgi:hypothetical protein
VIVVRDWLASRDPAPPGELAARLAAIAGASSCHESELPATLAGMAEPLLGGVCDDRSAALDLLAADALITYALEAAASDCTGLSITAGSIANRIAMVASRDGQA